MLLHQTSLSLNFLRLHLFNILSKTNRTQTFLAEARSQKDTCTHGILEKRRISAIEKPFIGKKKKKGGKTPLILGIKNCFDFI